MVIYSKCFLRGVKDSVTETNCVLHGFVENVSKQGEERYESLHPESHVHRVKGR